MTNNDNDIDIDNQDDDFGQDSAPKASMKEAWDNNPLMKIGAVVLGAVVLFGLYVTFSPKEEAAQGKANTNIGSTSNVKAAPGSADDLDEDLKNRLEEQNRVAAERAAQQGTSAMPLSIDGTRSEDISIPAAPQTTQEDPLGEWRRAAEARALQEMSAPPSQDLPAEKDPEVVPMPTPIRPQQAAMKMDPNVAKALADQMRVIISAQAPSVAKLKSITREESPYMIQKKELKEMSTSGISAGSMGAGSPGVMGAGLPTASSAAGIAPGMGPDVTLVGDTNAKSKKDTLRVISPAGSILYAQLLNDLNSDIPGPVLAHVLSGPFAGGRALGKFSVQQEYLVLEFSVIVKEAVGYDITGIALDEKTTLAGHQTDIDHHYFRRVILPAAAKFIEGYASAASEQVTTTTTTTGGGVVQNEEPLDTNKELMKGVEEAAGEFSSVLTEQANRPITIHVAKGTTFGILMMSSVLTDTASIQVKAN